MEEQDKFDDKGRPVYSTMDERELLVEILQHMRGLSDAVEAIGDNPMIRAMLPASMK